MPYDQKIIYDQTSSCLIIHEHICSWMIMYYDLPKPRCHIFSDSPTASYSTNQPCSISFNHPVQLCFV